MVYAITMLYDCISQVHCTEAKTISQCRIQLDDLIKATRQWQVQDFPQGTPTPEGEIANLVFGIIFAEICMKMKNIKSSWFGTFCFEELATCSQNVSCGQCDVSHI